MIINRNGEILEYFLRENGIVVKDGEFSICLEYNQEQKEQYARLTVLKELLSGSDYKALKHSDGVLTEEEYAPVRVERQLWRNEINEIERIFSEPVITREEMNAAEKKAIENFNQMKERAGRINGKN